MASVLESPSWAEKSSVFGSGDTFLLLNVFPDDVANDLFYSLQTEVQWNSMKSNGKRVPRDVSIQGTLTVEDDDEYEPLYRHPADEQPELLSWTPTARKIKDHISQMINQNLNHALIQRYRTSKDNIGEHSDKTLDILMNSNIVNYSLGAARRMILINKKDRSIDEEIKLPHNSLFILGWRTNREWQHGIRPDRRPMSAKDPDECAFYGERISLTLRTVATFLNRRTGRIYGQGARCKTIQQMRDMSNEEWNNDDKEMVFAFSAENRQSTEFDWEKNYGRGFHALNFKILNSKKKTS